MNRIDEVITFNRLGKDEIIKIVDIQIGHLLARLAEQNITLSISEEAKIHLGELGYDPLFGARPLKRTIQNSLQNPLARKILAGEIKESALVKVDLAGGALSIKSGPTV